MNIKALNYLERVWIRIDWQDWFNRVDLKQLNLESIVDMIDVFKTNRSVQELVIAKYVSVVPIYVVVSKHEYVELLEYIKNYMIEQEAYEICERIVSIIKKIKK